MAADRPPGEGPGRRRLRCPCGAGIPVPLLVLAGPLLVLVDRRAGAAASSASAQDALRPGGDGPDRHQRAGRLQDPRTVQDMLSEIHSRTGTACPLSTSRGASASAQAPRPSSWRRTRKWSWPRRHPRLHRTEHHRRQPMVHGRAHRRRLPLKRVTRFPMMQVETPVGAVVLSRPAPIAWLGVTHLGTRLAILGSTMLAISSPSRWLRLRAWLGPWVASRGRRRHR